MVTSLWIVAAVVDDRTIVVAMVDFAVAAQFGLIYSKKLIASTAIFSHSFDNRAFKL